MQPDPMMPLNRMQNYTTAQMFTPKLAHAYVPYQCMTCVYPPMQGLQQGTIFPDLDRPYGVDPEYTIDQ